MSARLFFLYSKLQEISLFHVLLIILSVNYLTFFPDGNEETYFQLAKQWVTPSWIPNAFSVTEPPGARLLYQYIVGFSLKYLSFEWMVFIGRSIIILWYSFTLSKIFLKLVWSPIQLVILFQGIIYFFPSFFGGESIFIGFEAKHIAYGFCFMAIHSLLIEKYTTTIVYLLLGAWFHILVGGWLLAVVLIYLFLFTDQKRIIVIGYTFLFVVGLSPLIYYLLPNLLATDSNTISADYIYTYIRNPHHTALFKDLSYFLKTHALGVLLSLSVTIVLIIIIPTLNNYRKKLAQLCLIIGLMGMLFVCVAYFDKEGHILKFYPFRLQGVFTFLTAILLIELLLNKTSYFILFILILPLPFFIGAKNLYKQYQYCYSKSNAFYQMSYFIKDHTNKNTVVYYPTIDDNYTLQFTRISERDRFFVHKLVPGGGDKIYAWYERYQISDEVEKDIASITKLKTFGVQYYVSTKAIIDSHLELTYQNSDFWVYKINY
ncbi:MAG: hypothetical protein U0U66_13560 [Cytophagaceae bacterium]